MWIRYEGGIDFADDLSSVINIKKKLTRDKRA